VIPLASPLANYRAHAGAIGEALKRVIESAATIRLGREVEDFESAFADYCSTKYAIGFGEWNRRADPGARRFRQSDGMTR